jgi:hypothetical protein
VRALTIPGLSSPFGVPVLELGPLVVERMADDLDKNTVRFVASQTARMGFLEDHLFLVIHAIRGAIHRRVQNRGEVYQEKDEFSRANDLLAHLRHVLEVSEQGAGSPDPSKTRDALIELAATATEWVVAIDRTPTEKE